MKVDKTPPGAPREAPLSMDREAFRAAGHELVDLVAELFATMPERPVVRAVPPAAVLAALDAEAHLPESGTDPRALLRSTYALLAEHSLFNGHPRFFGYVTAPPAPIGVLGELLAAAINANVGGWRLAPMATEIEAQTIRWIAELVGYPAGGGGLLLSGGNMANTVALFAARVAAAPWDIRKEGVAAKGAARLRVYASAETHTWINKATDLAGLGTDAIRWIPTNDAQRMDLDALGRALAEDRSKGELPMMVVGTAGSVSTGAVDPLHELAELCAAERLWFHVDGAYGGFAAAVPGASEDLGALSRADSVALDPHKWLYAPIEAGALLVRDAARLRAAFTYRPRYYHFDSDVTNFVDYGPQNTRGFRALKVWLALRHAGREGYVKMIGDDIRLSERLAELVGERADLELFTQSLSIATFRYLPPDLRDARARTVEDEAYLDRLNQELLDCVQRSGEVFVSNAIVRGRYVLRACIVNFCASAADVEATPDIIARLGSEIDARLRPGAAPA